MAKRKDSFETLLDDVKKAAADVVTESQRRKLGSGRIAVKFGPARPRRRR